MRKKTKSKLTAQVFVYVEPSNKAYIKEIAKDKYGSDSAFINHLISKARGTKSSGGRWKPKA